MLGWDALGGEYGAVLHYPQNVNVIWDGLAHQLLDVSLSMALSPFSARRCCCKAAFEAHPQPEKPEKEIREARCQDPLS